MDTTDDQVFTAAARCRCCGAGLARPASDPRAFWSCSALARGDAPPGLHDTLDPLLTWLPAETDRHTTRPATVIPFPRRPARTA